MTIALMVDILSDMKVIKNVRPKNQGLRRAFYPLLGIHQDIGIGVFLKMKKRGRKIMGKNIGFFVSDDRIQKFDPCKCMNKIINFFKNIFWYIIKEVCIVLLYLL